MNDLQLEPEAQKRLDAYNAALLRDDGSVEHELATYMDAFIQGIQGHPHPPYELLKGDDYITDIKEENNTFDVMEEALHDYCRAHGTLEPGEYDELAKAADALAFYNYQNYAEPEELVAAYVKRIQRENTINAMDKEDVIFEGMKILSENRTRTEKEATALRSQLEEVYQAAHQSPVVFLDEVRENAIDICESLKIAPPVHSWANFAYAGGDPSQTTVESGKPKGTPGCFDSLTVEHNDYGYTSVTYFASERSRIDVFAYDQLIGTIQNHGAEEKSDVTIYGQGAFQDLLKKEVEDLKSYSFSIGYDMKIVPDAHQRFPGIQRVLEDFRKSGKEVSYTSGKTH